MPNGFSVSIASETRRGGLILACCLRTDKNVSFELGFSGCD